MHHNAVHSLWNNNAIVCSLVRRMSHICRAMFPIRWLWQCANDFISQSHSCLYVHMLYHNRQQQQRKKKQVVAIDGQRVCVCVSVNRNAIFPHTQTHSHNFADFMRSKSWWCGPLNCVAAQHACIRVWLRTGCNVGYVLHECTTEQQHARIVSYRRKKVCGFSSQCAVFCLCAVGDKMRQYMLMVMMMMVMLVAIGVLLVVMALLVANVNVLKCSNKMCVCFFCLSHIWCYSHHTRQKCGGGRITGDNASELLLHSPTKVFGLAYSLAVCCVIMSFRAFCT